MSDLEKAARQALDALEAAHDELLVSGADEDFFRYLESQITALRAALAQQAKPVVDKALTNAEPQVDKEQAEPVCPICSDADNGEVCSTKPCGLDGRALMFGNEQQADPVACVCGDSTQLGIVHRADGPCFAPVPPKSFRVGYMTGYDDGQRELREKQQAGPRDDDGNPSF